MLRKPCPEALDCLFFAVSKALSMMETAMLFAKGGAEL